MKKKIERILNLFPEVTWDRWTGELNDPFGIGIFGWIPRDDGRSDFILLRIDGAESQDGVWLMTTSSAQYSAEFARRLGYDTHGHCKRAADLGIPSLKVVN